MPKSRQLVKITRAVSGNTPRRYGIRNQEQGEHWWMRDKPAFTRVHGRVETRSLGQSWDGLLRFQPVLRSTFCPVPALKGTQAAHSLFVLDTSPGSKTRPTRRNRCCRGWGVSDRSCYCPNRVGFPGGVGGQVRPMPLVELRPLPIR